jgi:GT2 family glycosyltransferase
MKDIAILVASWKSPDLLKVLIPSLLKSTKSNSEIIVVLNEADNESIKYLKNISIKTIILDRNYGPAAVDFAIPYMNEVGFKYVANINDDMIFAENWDIELINLIQKKNRCTVSSSMVEPFEGDYFFYDNLGNFFNSDNYRIFNDNVKSNKYVAPLSISYNPPIMCTYDDYISVNGYSNNLKKEWIDLKGKGLDDDFSYRLFNKYNGDFTFIKSNKSFVYHGGSMTIKKLPFQSGRDTFYRLNGITIDDFRKKIKLRDIINIV